MNSEYFLLGRYTLEEHYKSSLFLQIDFKTLQAERIFGQQRCQQSHTFICTPQLTFKGIWESGVLEAPVVLNKK